MHMDCNHSPVKLVRSRTSWVALLQQVNHKIGNKDPLLFQRGN